MDRNSIREEIVKDFEDLNRAFENSVDNNLKLEDKIALLEKALELACLSLRSKCDYCKYKDDEICPPDHHCSNLVMEYFKEQAKEIMKSE